MRQQNTWQVHSHMSCTGRPFADWITFLGLNDRITFLWLNPCCISGLSLTSTRSTWFLCWCAIGQDIAHYSTHPRTRSLNFRKKAPLVRQIMTWPHLGWAALRFRYQTGRRSGMFQSCVERNLPPNQHVQTPPRLACIANLTSVWFIIPDWTCQYLVTSSSQYY